MGDGPGLLAFHCREMVLKTSAGTLDTAKERLQLLEQRRFVSWEKDFVRFHDAQPSHVRIYRKQVLSVPSNMAGSEEAV